MTSHPDAHTDAFWVGYLSQGLLTALRFLDSSPNLARDDIKSTLEAFLRSPVASPELRVALSRQVRRR